MHWFILTFILIFTTNSHALVKDELYEEFIYLQENLYEDDDEFESYNPTQEKITTVADENIQDLDETYFTDEVSTKLSGIQKESPVVEEEVNETIEDLDKMYFSK